MDYSIKTNDELQAEKERLEKIFEECKEKIDILFDTMEKASIEFNKIDEILKERGA